MELEAVVAALRDAGAADDDPSTVAVALAAAGVLAARDADRGGVDLRRPPSLRGDAAPGPFPVVVPNVRWTDPAAWLERVGDAAAVLPDWWDAEVTADEQLAVGVRLIVPDGLAADASAVVRTARGVASVVVPAALTPDPPRWTWPLRLATAPGWPAVPRRVTLDRPPSWWPTLVVPVDVEGPWAVAGLALLDGDPAAADEPARAAAVVLPGDPLAPPPLDALVALATRHRAALVAVVAPVPDRDTWMVELVTELSHDLPLDVALHRAGPAYVLADADVVGRLRARAPVLLTVARVLSRPPGPGERPVRGDPVLDDLADGPWGSELGFGSTAAVRLRAEQARGRREAERLLLAELQQDGRATTGIAPGTGYDLVVGIGPGQGPTPFPDAYLASLRDALDPTPSVLTVTLTDLTLGPGEVAAAPTRTLRLPRTGSAEPVTFPVRSGGPGTPLAYRVVVTYRSRFLQTGVLRGVVGNGTPASFAVESVVRTDTAEPATAHDVALVLNHTDVGTPVVAALAGDAAVTFAPDELAGVITEVTDLLHRMVYDPEGFAAGRTSSGFGALMVDLALVGRALHRALFGRMGLVDPAWRARLTDAARISVLSARPTAAAPVELVYDRPLADGILAEPPRLCPEAATHLRDGACPGTCGDAAALVCPFGFWGVRKVIERHVNEDGAGSSTRVALAVAPDVERHRIALTDVFAAAAAKADHNDVEAWTSAAAGLRDVTLAGSWRELAEAVALRRAAGCPPRVLMLVTHVARDGGRQLLEIGEGDRRAVLGGWDPLLVLAHDDGLDAAPYAANPLVMVLGCGTAGLGREVLSPPAQLLGHGAPAVVSSIATVLGRDIVPVGVTLLDELRRAALAGGRGSLLGTAMRAARRRCLADGHAAVLALVAFGDADWQLSP